VIASTATTQSDGSVHTLDGSFVLKCTDPSKKLNKTTFSKKGYTCEVEICSVQLCHCGTGRDRGRV